MKKRQQDTLFKSLVGLLVALVFIVGAQYFSQHQIKLRERSRPSSSDKCGGAQVYS